MVGTMMKSLAYRKNQVKKKQFTPYTTTHNKLKVKTVPPLLKHLILIVQKYTSATG